MSQLEEMRALRARIVRAEAERDRWRAAGNQPNYLDAYARVQQLALQMVTLRQAGLRSLAGKGAARITDHERMALQAPLMRELGITFDGRQYRCFGGRYNTLERALARARRRSWSTWDSVR
jgi:hypothetical protein